VRSLGQPASSVRVGPDPPSSSPDGSWFAPLRVAVRSPAARGRPDLVVVVVVVAAAVAAEVEGEAEVEEAEVEEAEVEEEVEAAGHRS
jgi:hypothetical protein